MVKCQSYSTSSILCFYHKKCSSTRTLKVAWNVASIKLSIRNKLTAKSHWVPKGALIPFPRLFKKVFWRTHMYQQSCICGTNQPQIRGKFICILVQGLQRLLSGYSHCKFFYCLRKQKSILWEYRNCFAKNGFWKDDHLDRLLLSFKARLGLGVR